MAKRLADLVSAARARIREVDPETAEEMARSRKDVLVVDVREPEEFAAGRVPGAFNIPRGMLEASADPDYRRPHPELCRAHRRPVLLYCRTGARSALAAATLEEMGFEEVYNVAGGAVTWTADDCAWEGEVKEEA